MISCSSIDHGGLDAGALPACEFFARTSFLPSLIEITRGELAAKGTVFATLFIEYSNVR
jgi:hypothetical protein